MLITETSLCTLEDGEVGGKVVYTQGGRTRVMRLDLSEFEEAIQEVEDRPDPLVLAFMRRPAPTKQLMPYDYSILSEVGQTYLYAYQKEILDTILRVHGGRTLVGMEQGTGKTPVAVAAMAWYGTPGMYVVPGGKLKDFEHDHRLISGKDIQIIKSRKDPIKCGFIVTTSDMAKVHPGILSTKWCTIIVDEAHKLSGEETTVYAQKLFPLFRQARALLMMTGTPEKSKHADLFAALTCLHPKVFPSHKDFTTRYCEGKLNKFGKWDISKSRYGPELHLVLSKFMVRYTKAQALPHLPSKTRVKVVMQVKDPGDQAAFARDTSEMKSIQRDIDRTSHVASKLRLQNKVNQIANALWRMSGQVKVRMCMPWVIKLIQDHPTEKFILFCVHLDIADKICEALTKHEIRSVCVKGSVPSLKREKVLAPVADVANMDVRVAVLTMCCAEGINLWMCSRVILFEYPRTPGTAEQAEDRSHRNHLTKPMTCYYLHAEGSRDPETLRKLVQKSQTNSMVIAGDSGPSLTFDQEIRVPEEPAELARALGGDKKRVRVE